MEIDDEQNYSLLRILNVSQKFLSLLPYIKNNKFDSGTTFWGNDWHNSGY